MRAPPRQRSRTARPTVGVAPSGPARATASAFGPRESPMKSKRLRTAGVVPHRNQSPAADSSRSVRSKSARENFRPASISRMSALTRSRRLVPCGSSWACKNAANSSFSSPDKPADSFFSSASDMKKTVFDSSAASIRRYPPTRRRRATHTCSGLLPHRPAHGQPTFTPNPKARPRSAVPFGCSGTRQIIRS